MESAKNMDGDKTSKKNLPLIKWLVFSVLIFSIAGVAVSAQLTRIHWLTHTDPSYHSVCAINDKINCETVAQSPYSVFLGVPNSGWGLLGYAVIAFFCIIKFPIKSSGKSKKHLTGVLFFLLAAMMIFSANLAYVSFIKINVFCIFCAALYAINTISLIIIGVAILKIRKNPIVLFVNDVQSFFRRQYLALSLIFTVIICILGVELFLPVYWQHPGWSKIPSLPTGITDEGLHWTGYKDAPIVIQEFSDYQCPHCRHAHKSLRIEIAKYNKIKLIHRHLPLDSKCNTDVDRSSFHQRACEFAEATLCAGKQGKFWEMNDAIFSIQDKMSSADIDLDILSVRLGLDRTAFTKCLKNHETLSQIKKDIVESRRKNIKGTPAFIIGKKMYRGRVLPAVLKNLIEKHTHKVPGG